MPPPADHPARRRLGATPRAGGQVDFRVWAPDAERVVLALGGAEHPLEPEGGGLWLATRPAAHGDRYALSLDGAPPLPDPASRWQPDGLRGPSAVLDPGTFAWSDERWPGVPLAGLVISEIHVGTFSEAGTFDGAIEHLDALAELGVTAIELMPVAEFPGARGWGYDGVYLSAAQSSYGGPEGLARLVDAAHARGLAVLLDVVYNHLGASGVQAVEAFGPYFTDRYDTPWGRALNYDDARCDPVREWVLQSAEGWIRDLHVDGLRVDALHAIYDASAHPLPRALAERVRTADPRALVVAESGMNDPKVTRPVALGGFGHDAQWADDFHHALRVLLTGDAEGYYAEFGSLADLVKCLHRPFKHDGTYSTFRAKRFGAPADDRPPEQFVVFSANHDQVGNRALGDRLADELRPLAAFATLLSPFTPMLFQGDEYGERAPFRFFCDHIDPDIAQATRDGRRREFAAFAAFAGEAVPDPQAPETMAASTLTRVEQPGLRALHAALLAARRRLGAAPVEVLSADESAKVLHLRRGAQELAMNFAREPRTLTTNATELDLTTHPDGVRLDAGTLALAPLSAALTRR